MLRNDMRRHAEILQDPGTCWANRSHNCFCVESFGQPVCLTKSSGNQKQVAHLDLTGKDDGVYPLRNNVFDQTTQHARVLWQKPLIETQFYQIGSPLTQSL